jgi:excisionase family DNA binding protein
VKDRPDTTEGFDPNQPDENTLFTTAKAAELFGVTTETVRDWITTGKLVAVRLPSKQYRIRRKDLMTFANSTYEASSKASDAQAALI